jgi:MFS family permease
MNPNYRGICSVIGGFILHLVIGCFYLWGVINIYVTSYYRLHGEPSLNTSLTSGLFPIFLLFVGLTFFFGVKLAEKIGIKLACLIESLWMSMAVLLSSFMPDFWSFMFFFAIVYGFGSGLLYLVPIYVASKHFPDKKGLVTGIIVAGNGIATLMASQMSQTIINPDNKKPISMEDGKYFMGDIAEQVPVFLKYLALYFGVLSVLGSVLIMPKDEKNKENLKQKLVNEVETENEQKNVENDRGEATFKEVLKCVKTKDYLLLFSMNCLSSGFGLMISVQFKDYGLKQINDDQFLTLIGSIGFIFNAGFRIIWGYLMDKFGFRKVYWLLLSCQLGLICSLNAICEYKAVYFVWICLILACEGGHFSLFPTVTLKQFGIKLGGFVYPYVYFAFVISNFIQFFIVLGLLDVIEYKNVFWIYAGLTFLAGILNFFFKEKK